MNVTVPVGLGKVVDVTVIVTFLSPEPLWFLTQVDTPSNVPCDNGVTPPAGPPAPWAEA